MKKYWSQELGLSIDRFKYVAIDKRTIGRPTFSHYKGVCVLLCGNVAIQRRLVFLYTMFCRKVINEGD